MMPAVFSPDRRYRYLLRRRRGLADGSCLFVMLNPSTADEVQDDPTIRRCLGFAVGYGELVVCNLFALRATDPKVLYDADDPVGPGNDKHIIDAAYAADRVILALGTHGELLDRGDAVRRMLEQRGIRLLHYGQLTINGQPRHPLYLRRNASLHSFG